MVEASVAEAEGVVVQPDAVIRRLSGSAAEGCPVEECAMALEVAVARLQIAVRKLVEWGAKGPEHNELTREIYRTLRLH